MWTSVNGGSNDTGSGATSVAVTTTWSVAVGDLIVVCLSQFGGLTSGLSISDSGGNSWSQVVNYTGEGMIQTVWTTTVTTGGTLTITCTATTPAFLTLLVNEFSCAGTIGAAESLVHNNGPSTPASPGTITASETDLLLAYVSTSGQGGNAITISSGFTVASNAVTASAHSDAALGYASIRQGPGRPHSH